MLYEDPRTRPSSSIIIIIIHNSFINLYFFISHYIMYNQSFIQHQPQSNKLWSCCEWGGVKNYVMSCRELKCFFWTTFFSNYKAFFLFFSLFLVIFERYVYMFCCKDIRNDIKKKKKICNEYIKNVRWMIPCLHETHPYRQWNV